MPVRIFPLWIRCSYAFQCVGFRVWLLNKISSRSRTIMAAKAGASWVPIAMPPSCVNLRLSYWKMLFWNFFHAFTIICNFRFLPCRPYKVTFRVNFFFVTGFKCISSFEFFNFCHCVHAMQKWYQLLFAMLMLFVTYSHHVQFWDDWSTSLCDRMFPCS